MYTNEMPINNVVGNAVSSDKAIGFKDEVKHVFESYQGSGVNLASDLMSIVQSPTAKQEFVDNVMESMTTSPVFTNGAVANNMFYGNYAQRTEQLLDNSLVAVARESAMIGYAPIVAYNPFFLKNQWINCVMKDVLMTEVPQSPVINLAYEKRYLKTLDGTEYAIPFVNYDNEAMAKLVAESTGAAIKEEPILLTKFKPSLKILSSTYIPGIVDGDLTAELTAGIEIVKVALKDSTGAKHTVPTSIRCDITTHNFTNGAVKYDATVGANVEKLTDVIHGSVNFKDGTVTLFSETDTVVEVTLRGKVANRFNQRSLDVVRRVEQIQHVMPESGHRLNTAVTVEDAADALVLQKIDVIADNVDIMGRTLAELEDFEIRSFLDNSFDAQESAGVGPHGYEKLTVKSSFNALPYETYNGLISNWMTDSREYFERTIETLKDKLKSPDAIITVVCNPQVVRFLQDGINWVFSDETQISGLTVDYNFGIYTSAQDRVHIITTRYIPAEKGLKFVVIPTTTELVTFKHYKYNIVIDRNYRNPLYTLTPNIMTTHRTLTFEVLPVQGQMLINGRDLFSPETLERA